jgi:hypothetical protein
VNEDAAYRAMDLLLQQPTASATSPTPRSPATNAVVRDDGSHDDSHSSDVDNDAATATGTRGWVPLLQALQSLPRGPAADRDRMAVTRSEIPIRHRIRRSASFT